MKVVQCPDHHNNYEFNPILFMAGGISNCPDWQTEMVDLFHKEQCEQALILINPRRVNFSDAVAEKQIEWEYTYLKMADAVSFWFPKETLCPITLFELGAAAYSGKKIFVGCEPGYQRTLDVHTQLRLHCPDVKVHSNLQDVVKEVITGLKKGDISSVRSWRI